MLGERVKDMRERKAWSQGHLADAAGLNIRTVQRIEAGELCSYETMLSLSAALGVDVSQLEPENRRGDRKASFSKMRTAVAALGILPAALFIGVNVLRSAIGLSAPYELLASAGQRIVAFETFNAVSPFVFFGGAAVALAICLPALVRVRAKIDSGQLTISGIQVSAQRLPLILTATALFSAAILLTYVALEQVSSVGG
ncbi:MAG: helix-turn-helix transcriptional regulator [Sphingomicrobium sp.]